MITFLVATWVYPETLGLLVENALMRARKIDFSRLVEFHRRNGRPIATLALVEKVPLEVGIVKLRNSRVVDFVEKPPINETAWSGVAVLRTDLVSRYCNYFVDLAKDVFPRLIAAGESIYGYLSKAEYLDMGTIQHYRRACEMARKEQL